MSNKYLITLEPLDTYFFGQESKYRKKNGKIEPDYYQKSAYFPQQTTLLGMLRYYILLINGQIPITDKKTAEELIGENSFDAGKDNDFKTIKCLSEVFIVKYNKFYYPNPKDLLLKDKKIKKLEADKGLDVKTNASKKFYYFPEYKEKEGLSGFLYHSIDDFLPLNYDKDENPAGVFIEVEKIGITKAKTGQTLNKAFYKQVALKLNKGIRFGFVATIDHLNMEKVQKNPFVFMGAEKNAFKIEFHDFNEDLRTKIEFPDNNKPKIVLLSDAYLPEFDTNDFNFAIMDTKTFRFLQTQVRENNNKYYSSDPVKGNNIKRSGKFNLIKSGSVFYFENEAQMNTFSKKLEQVTNFKKIGYNQHLKIK